MFKVSGSRFAHAHGKIASSDRAKIVKTLISGLTRLNAVRPSGWTHQSLPNDDWRQYLTWLHPTANSAVPLEIFSHLLIFSNYFAL